MKSAPLDYLLGHGLTPATAPSVLGAEVALHAEPMERVERSFYDTFDGRLRAAGMACVSEAGRVTLFAQDGHPEGEVASMALNDGGQRISAIELGPGAMRDALLPLVEVRALTRIARVRSRRRTLAVLDELQKTVARIIVEQPTVVLDGQRDVRLPARLRLAPVRGYDKALARLRAVLEGRLGLAAAPSSLLDEAVSASGGVPGGVSSKVNVELDAVMRADVAAALVLRRLLEVIRANLAGTIADLDAEFLHDFRVAVRRSRAVQRELREVFPRGELAAFRREFRWLQQVTGDARDLDVYVLEFDEFRAQLSDSSARDLEPLLRVLGKRRSDAHRKMVRALRSRRAVVLLDDWEAFLGGLEGDVGALEGGVDAGLAAASPIAEVAGARIAKVYRRMVRMGAAIDDSTPAEEYHELRKKGKELRYLLELFGGVFPGEVVKPMVRTLKALQDTLGRHQDREVQVATLHALGDAVAQRPGGAAGLMAMGMLVERLQSEEAAARGEFAERFAAFAAKPQAKLVRDTFQ